MAGLTMYTPEMVSVLDQIPDCIVRSRRTIAGRAVGQIIH